jgi:hypothetical protein
MIHARHHGISEFFIGIIGGSVSELINARGSGRKRHFGKILKTSNCEEGMSMKKIYCTT